MGHLRCRDTTLAFSGSLLVCLPKEQKGPKHYSCLHFQSLEPYENIVGAPEKLRE